MCSKKNVAPLTEGEKILAPPKIPQPLPGRKLCRFP